MITELKGGTVVDPSTGATSLRSVYFEDGRIREAPGPGETVGEVHDCRGKIVMAGAVDVHSHIAGGNVTMARLLLPELHVSEDPAGAGMPFSTARWSAWETGRLYAEMGYTTVIEPALAPAQALQTHLELADIPIIDRGALTVVGNDDHFLSQLRAREGRNALRDSIAYALKSSKGLGLKLINAGGPAAFHSGLRTFDIDDVVPHYGVTSRDILGHLLTVVDDIGVPHPLHVHANNLGVNGAPDTIDATIAAAEGRRIHFAHIQFYSYLAGSDGVMTSGAEQIARALAASPNVTCDVGQVMFGPTVTISLDLMKQWAGMAYASPKKSVLNDGDAEGGGVVPFVYKSSSWVNALQWAIGLEIFLLSPDPRRVLLTTDHPNGGSFTTYPQIIHLLMDAGERARWLERMPEKARERSGLAALTREYTLEEIALMTRAGPAELLGLSDRGHLAPGAIADIAVYDDLADRTRMFSRAALVFKDGRLAVRDGSALGWMAGRTSILTPDYDRLMDRRMADYLSDRYGVGPAAFAVPPAAFAAQDMFKVEPCRN